MTDIHPQPSLVTVSPEPRLGAPLAVSVVVPVYNERHLVAASLGRLLAVRDPLIARLQVIVVDDHSTDGSWEVVQQVAAGDPRVTVVRHERNGGKGAALATGIRLADGDVTLFHDADLEYNPADIPALLRPFVLEGADAVFGSRFLAAPYRRALMFRHSIMNRMLTRISNLFTDLDLTDVETCYKAVRTPLLQSIPIRSRDFRVEVELTMKLAKRGAHVFEVPIRYLPRTYREGKKIGARDGLRAVGALMHFSLVDDLYREDEYGSHMLHHLEGTPRYNVWVGDKLRPFVGDRVLEIGAGIGTLTSQLIPRTVYVVSDVNPNYLHYLRSYATGKPYLEVRRIDADDASDFVPLHGRFDTVLVVNVLEHVEDEGAALANIRNALLPGGRAVVLVPQHPRLFSALDRALGHRERYTSEGLRRSLAAAGLTVEHIFDFNRVSVPAWWFTGKVLRRKVFSRLQLKIFDTGLPVIRRLDRLFPYSGQSLIAIARRPD